MESRRHLPSIDKLVRLAPELPHALAVREARALVEAVRCGAAAPADWAAALTERVQGVRETRLRRVINATGIVLHTNLGRAPLGAAAAEAVGRIALGYSNLELNLETGTRGERLAGVSEPLKELCGAPAALAVNNNAAATMLMLTGLARGREVIVSRGELVEIGGAFRIPDVITAGGARLVEVGTTNRTRLADYASAITPDTAAVLRVHPSNFRVVGFTEEADRTELAALAHARGVLYLEDLGAGALVPGLGEPTVREVLACGADVVSFSGDKLLGGPQAGLLVGSVEPLLRLRKHPLYRALRLDRLVLAALEVTLRGYLAGELPPAVTMMTTTRAALRVRAEACALRLAAAGVANEVVDDVGFAGGGSRPEDALPTVVIVVPHPHPDRLAARLRAASPPVLARVSEGDLRVDLRAVLPEEEGSLVDALVWACRSASGA